MLKPIDIIIMRFKEDSSTGFFFFYIYEEWFFKIFFVYLIHIEFQEQFPSINQDNFVRMQTFQYTCKIIDIYSFRTFHS